MSKFFVDFENVRSEGLRGIENLTEEDQVWIFYSKNADSITFEVYDLIGKSKAKIHKYKIARGGKNSLDFQLSSFVGYMLHEDWFDNYYLISNDNGYRYVLDFWRITYERQGVRLFEVSSIQEALKPYHSKKDKKTSDSLTEEEVPANLPEESEDEEVLQGELVSYAEPAEVISEEFFSDQTETEEPVEHKTAENAPVGKETVENEPGKKEPVEKETIETEPAEKPAEPEEKKKTKKNSRNRKRGQNKAEVESDTVGSDSKQKTSDSKASDQLKNASAEEEEVSSENVPSSGKDEHPASKEESAPEKNENAEKKPGKKSKGNGRRSGKKSAESLAAQEVSEETKASEAEASQTSEVSEESSEKQKSEAGTADQKKKTGRKTKKDASEEPVVPRLAKGEVRSRLNGLLTKANLPESVDLSTCVKKSCEFVIESDGKKAFYDRVIGLWGQKVGMEIYKVLKSEYPNLKKIITQAMEENKK